MVAVCDECRKRKQRCGGGPVCPFCERNKLQCGYTYVPKKRGPQPKKAKIDSVSFNYESTQQQYAMVTSDPSQQFTNAPTSHILWENVCVVS